MEEPNEEPEPPITPESREIYYSQTWYLNMRNQIQDVTNQLQDLSDRAKERFDLNPTNDFYRTQYLNLFHRVREIEAFYTQILDDEQFMETYFTRDDMRELLQEARQF